MEKDFKPAFPLLQTLCGACRDSAVLDVESSDRFGACSSSGERLPKTKSTSITHDHQLENHA
jgi:hypothetical protein